MKLRLIQWAEDGYPPNDLNANAKDVRELISAHQTLNSMHLNTIKEYEIVSHKLSVERTHSRNVSDENKKLSVLNQQNLKFKSMYYVKSKKKSWLDTIMLIIAITLLLMVLFYGGA